MRTSYGKQIGATTVTQVLPVMIVRPALPFPQWGRLLECEDGWAGPHCATRVTVRITAAPLPVTTTKEGVFTFSSNGTVTFECALDDADFALCDS